jgi:TM2 domain-containing membrane protein YozV
MRGTVIHFSIQENKGFIVGEDNNRYEFSGESWGLKALPEQGSKVDFGIEDNRAIKIFADSNALPEFPKSRTHAATLALVLGGLGAHLFYLEAWGWAILSVLFCWTYIPAIISFIFAVRWYTMSDKEFQQKAKYFKGTFPEVRF